MAVSLWYLPVVAQALDPGLLEPCLGDIQRKSPRGEDNAVYVRVKFEVHL